MFRKPKGCKKAGMRRRKRSDDSDEETSSRPQNGNGGEEEESTSALLSEARKRTKMAREKSSAGTTSSNPEKSSVMHQYATSTGDTNQKLSDLVTSTVQVHAENQAQQLQSEPTGVGDDGIFRDKSRSKLLAGPIKATGHIRTTCRFDYQPDVCKDYKDTGFCGFGDTCIYLHDRGDTLSGWQLEKQWEEEQKRKKEQQEREIQGFVDGTKNNSQADEEKKNALVADDGLPFACHICREHFKNPVVTSCGHYFCEACIMNRVRTKSEACPICGKDTHGVFNQPTKLINKRRKVLGIAESRKEDSWVKFSEALSSAKGSEE